MSDQLYNETLIKECIIPLDELKSKFALVPLAVVREVLAAQGLHVVDNNYVQSYVSCVKDVSALNKAVRDIEEVTELWCASKDTDEESKMVGHQILDIIYRI